MTLPASFEALGAYRRFVTYTLEPDVDRPGKTIKRPTDVLTGLYCNSNDPEHQYSYDEAAATGRPVGFVFAAADGFFFLDIDGCREGDTWNAQANELCALFSGAAIEVSQSNNGLHIVARAATPPHACKNIPAQIELYTDQRFIALTGTNAIGDASTDHTPAVTALVTRYFPPNPHGEIAGWTAEPVEGYGGPADDTELLRAAMTSGRKSASAAFGTGVTFHDLWTADADKLAAKWPNANGGYDASVADASLAWHLAFWTGKDNERTRHLMQQSALARQKWDDRPDYLDSTIMKAASFAQNVAKGRPALQSAEHAKTVIIVHPGELDRIATEAERALLAAKMPIYQRGNLVTPVVNEVAAAGGHKTKVVRLASVGVPAMLDYLCRSARFEKWNVTKQEFVAANPPENLPNIILARAGDWYFPHLAGVITAPTLRPDGSLLTKPGYDPATRLLLIAPQLWPGFRTDQLGTRLWLRLPN